MNDLDFIIIGAQKAGTTSLYRYLAEHPAIHMPETKEVNFFSLDAQYEAGWKVTAQEHFAGAPTDRSWGIAPPRCMIDHYVPERIQETVPHVRLIAILRDPIDRAISHYMMSRRREWEPRSLQEAMRAAVAPEEAAAARALPYGREAETRCYLAWGEYGRILAAYRRRFRPDQVLILTLDELSDRPEDALGKVFHFLDVDEGVRPPNLGKAYHVGGTERRGSRALALLRNPVTRWFWSRAPKRLVRRFWFWWETTAIRRDKRLDVSDLDPCLRRDLVTHFDPDLQQLVDDWGVRPQWPAYPALAGG